MLGAGSNLADVRDIQILCDEETTRLLRGLPDIGIGLTSQTALWRDLLPKELLEEFICSDSLTGNPVISVL
jgi:hypothetical protein